MTQNSKLERPNFRQPRSHLWRDPRARLVLMANFLLVVGAGVTFMAVPWLLIHLPGGESLFGYSNAVVTLIVFLLLPYFGKMIDRNSRKKVLLGYLAFSVLLNTSVIVAVFLAGRVESWHLLTVYCLGSLAQTCYYPAQFAFNQEVFEPEFYESLSGAVEVQWQAGSMVAGALGTVLISRVPLWVILGIDTATYVCGFFLIALVPYRRAELTAHIARGKASAFRLMQEGFDYLRERPRLSLVVFSSFLPFLCLMVVNYLSPIFVKEVLKGGPEVYAIGEISYGLGAVLAGLTIPYINARLGLIETLLLTIGVFTLSLGAFPVFPVAIGFYLAFCFQGWGNAGSRVARSILVFKTVPNDLVGRVNLFYSALERMLRAMLLAAVTNLVAAGKIIASCGILVLISALGWLLVLACRRVRTYRVDRKSG